MEKQIVIVNYGMGNLNSVKKKLDRLNVNSIISSSRKDIANAEKIILPGVGHFGKAMDNLNNLQLIDVLNDFALTQKKPILGICLGMQIMATRSEEGNCKGFGWFDAEVVRFKVADNHEFKVPHMGWNQIEICKNSNLMKNIINLSELYFVHSYYFKTIHCEDVLNETEYNCKFVSAIEKNNIFGLQYHPEKSHDVGEMILKNFVEL